jgi:tetratricopeptide (TPR) repeat protein
MSRKRKKKEAPVPRSRRPALFVLVAVLGGALTLLVAYGLKVRRPAVPDPDLSAMEPQVGAKIAQARQAVLAAPDSHEAWGRFGMVLQAHRLEAEAAACYRRALELSPGEFRWPYLLAHALKDADAEGALGTLDAASRLKPDYAPAYVFRGQLLETSNRLDEAMAHYRRALEIEPENAMAEYGIGRLYLARGENRDALPHLLRARDLNEEAGAIHGALAQAYRQMGDMESALRENRLASQLTETIPITDPVHYAMRKESVSSVAQLQRAIEADREGDYQTAESLYEELVRIRPDDPNIRARFGDNLARQSKLGPAKEQYEAAIAVDPQLASAHYGLGNMLNLEGDYDGAASHYRAALESRPDHPGTLLNLAGILAFRGELAEAAALCRRALQIDPKGFAPNFDLGRVLNQKSSYREAIPFLRAAIDARPDSGPAQRQLSIALAGTGDYASAWKHLERALALGENVPEPLVEELRRRAQVSAPARRSQPGSR